MSGILIVDDDPTIRTMFARALKALGDIETAANGADALRLLAAKKYSVVLLDLHMPVIDGFVILHTLATKPGPNRDTSTFVITADTSDQARVRALRRHAVFLLTKPVPIATLVSLVDSALKKAASRGVSDGDAPAAPAMPSEEGSGIRPATPAPPQVKPGSPVPGAAPGSNRIPPGVSPKPGLPSWMKKPGT